MSASSNTRRLHNNLTNGRSPFEFFLKIIQQCKRDFQVSKEIRLFKKEEELAFRALYFGQQQSD
jgi:hypothetical protein